MISYIYKKCFDVLKSKPLMLWGLSLLASLLTVLASIFCVLPVISIPVVLTLEAGMTLVYLDGYKGNKVNSDQIFAGFKKFAHVAGGMAWMALWILIWGLIPVAGIVMAIIKTYEYRFAPYILMTQPEINATEALRLSMQKTKGYKGKMFLADLIICLALFVVGLILGLLAQIPYVGALFMIIYVLVIIVCYAFLPLFMGLVSAAFYYETENIGSMPAWNVPVAPQMPYQQYAQPTNPGAYNNGQPMNQPMNQAPQTPVYPTQPVQTPVYPTEAPVAPAEQPVDEPTVSTEAPVAAKTCPNCGSALSDDAKFCGKCGTEIK